MSVPPCVNEHSGAAAAFFVIMARLGAEERLDGSNSDGLSASVACASAVEP
jgi:hypothetical protein